MECVIHKIRSLNSTHALVQHTRDKRGVVVVVRRLCRGVQYRMGRGIALCRRIEFLTVGVSVNQLAHCLAVNFCSGGLLPALGAAPMLAQARFTTKHTVDSIQTCAKLAI